MVCTSLEHVLRSALRRKTAETLYNKKQGCSQSVVVLRHRQSMQPWWPCSGFSLQDTMGAMKGVGSSGACRMAQPTKSIISCGSGKPGRERWSTRERSRWDEGYIPSCLGKVWDSVRQLQVAQATREADLRVAALRSGDGWEVSAVVARQAVVFRMRR